MKHAADNLLTHLNPVHILRIDIAKTTTLEFEKTFSVDQTTSEEFKRITESRKDVVAASQNQFSETAITVRQFTWSQVAHEFQGVTQYLPMLFGLVSNLVYGL
jgi:hypothetical protein